MTIETKTTIQLRDLVEAEIECIACHTRVSWKPQDGDNFIPLHCKKCDVEFFAKGSKEHDDLIQLLFLINRYRHTVNYHLRFSLGDPKEVK